VDRRRAPLTAPGRQFAGVVRVPLKARYQARREVEAVRPVAARLVDRLFAEEGDPSRVAARIHEDASFDDVLRREAFQELMHRGGKE
jgi:hypothetical protein